MYIRVDDRPGTVLCSGRRAFRASTPVDTIDLYERIAGEAILMDLPRYACRVAGIAAAFGGRANACCVSRDRPRVSPRVSVARDKSSNRRGITLRAAWSRRCYRG